MRVQVEPHARFTIISHLNSCQVNSSEILVINRNNPVRVAPKELTPRNTSLVPLQLLYPLPRNTFRSATYRAITQHNGLTISCSTVLYTNNQCKRGFVGHGIQRIPLHPSRPEQMFPPPHSPVSTRT